LEPLKINLPKIIQGGMGIGVSNWHLANVVSRMGQLGVVSGTALDQVMARRLQDGDLRGDIRRALQAFPNMGLAQRVLDTFFIPGGKPAHVPYKAIGIHTIKNNSFIDELCVVANYVEVFLAREGHSNPVGINYLEKIQIPHLPSIYGAMLAGVSVIIMGAGIPVNVPKVLDLFCKHEAATYPIRVIDATPDTDCVRTFDPAMLFPEGLPPELNRPDFLPIISSDSLATMLLRRAEGSVEGFVIEGFTAGGHNAPPRGQMKFDELGQPIYGARDIVNLEAMRKIGLPFWLGGGYGSPEKLKEALDQGAAGIQVGTAFALCEDSAFIPELRTKVRDSLLAGKATVFTDPVVSPTGFPFKVASVEGTISDPEVVRQRTKICDCGYLLEAYRKPDGTVGYRCAAEPEAIYLAKGGTPESIVGRKCVCNALFAACGLPQVRANGYKEPGVVTLGDDALNVQRFCKAGSTSFTAEDVIRTILGA
jgi:nitronate monooxygenase